VLDGVAQRPVLTTARRYELMAELRSAPAARSKNLTPFKTLTPSERMVLSALAQGQRAETIAATAFLSKSTVRSQIRSMLAKLNVKSQLEAVALAWPVGWFPTEPQYEEPNCVGCYCQHAPGGRPVWLTHSKRGRVRWPNLPTRGRWAPLRRYMSTEGGYFLGQLSYGLGQPS
jgi:DNA-binding CsgD family transcriptional regulator